MSRFLIAAATAALALAMAGAGAQAAGDGGYPSGLTYSNGMLYGTTEIGGANQVGAVFQITTQGVETVLYSFAGRADGRNPYAGLLPVDGVLYGSTAFGGGDGCRYGLNSPIGCGTVFQITTAGVETVLYRFQGGPDGATPTGALTRMGANLYGVTQQGGLSNCESKYIKGCGTTFEITPAGGKTILHTFQGGPDGANPYAGLVRLGQTLYGTTEYGGAGPCHSKQVEGCGTVYQISSAGESVLYRFEGPAEGSWPVSSLAVGDGNLFGTASQSGKRCKPWKYGCGTVFKVTVAGAETTLHEFKGGADGAIPGAGLTKIGGAYYGTTSYGGTGCGGDVGCGTIFEITPQGHKRVLHNFLGGADGEFPSNNLTDVGGILYGTTRYGGGTGCYNGCGVVFEITPAGSYTALYSFQGP